MQKLLEIEFSDEVKKSHFIQLAVTLLTFSLFFMVRALDKSYFNVNFYFECIIIFVLIKYFNRSQKNKNYGFWGFSFLIGLYIFQKLLYFTFIEYNILIIYFSILAGIFLLINGYIMSSPLYYPRVSWWEYDFRYRGELKGKGHFSGVDFNLRLSDLRRNCASIIVFEPLPLGGDISIDILFGDKCYKLKGIIKTLREVIPGRPITYGVVLDEGFGEEKSELRKLWHKKKKANLRQKFTDIKGEDGV